MPMVKQQADKERSNNLLADFIMEDDEVFQNLLCWDCTYLTPESEVLHFGFEVPDVGYLWSILTVEKTRKTIFKLKKHI